MLQRGVTQSIDSSYCQSLPTIMAKHRIALVHRIGRVLNSTFTGHSPTLNRVCLSSSHKRRCFPPKTSQSMHYLLKAKPLLGLLTREAHLQGWCCTQHGASSHCQQHEIATTSSRHDGYIRERMHATTILCVRKDGQVVMMGDGQVSMGNTVVKPNARKIRRIGDNVVAGFAGSAADGLSLLERLETKLEEHPGQLLRAAVELAKQWRQDKALRFLQAELLVADATTTLTVAGNGDVIEPHDGVMAIGSGGPFAVAAARALMDVPGAGDAPAIAAKAMKIASDMCVFTNSNFVSEMLTSTTSVPPPSSLTQKPKL